MSHPENSISEKNYHCPQGPLAWLNDIEISKGPYLGSFLLLVLNIILIRQPFFEIDVPYLEKMAFALHDIKEFSGLGIGALILGIVSIFALIIPMLKFFEWKYRWFIPAAATAVIECAMTIYLIGKKNDLLESTLIGYTYQILSIEINLTASAWVLMAVNVLIMICSIKMLIDVKNNEIKY